MFLQEISLIDQIYQLLGVEASPELNIIIVPVAAILLLMLVRYTVSIFFEAFTGGYR